MAKGSGPGFGSGRGRNACPRGFICAGNITVVVVVVAFIVAAALFWYAPKAVAPSVVAPKAVAPKIYVVQAPSKDFNVAQDDRGYPSPNVQSLVRPDFYPEPVLRYNSGFGIHTRGTLGPIQQVGMLTGEGGSSSSAAPDRTILPLYGRELDVRRGRWNYYTRTDGTNPVQVPVRVKNRVCDDDTNGCDEVYSNDTVHVPALGRSFSATVYKKSIF